MEIESTSFGSGQLTAFFEELVDWDRRALVDRLEQASARLHEIGEELPQSPGPGAGGEWSAQEVLAHIAVLSKFYGVLTYQIGTGRLTDLDLAGQVRMRDVMGDQLSRQPAAELVAMATANHRRTTDWLRAATPADLLRRCVTGPDSSMSAEEVARLALCSHLEQHLEQLERALSRTR